MSKVYLKPLFQKLCKQREDKMKNFTVFADKLPEQGRWILVTDDIKNLKENGEPKNLWVVDNWRTEPGHPKIINANLPIICSDYGIDEITNLTHWCYAIKEGG